MVAAWVAILASVCLGPGGNAQPAATLSAHEAFVRGDYDGAEAGWKPAADRGDADGELGMGEVYEQGKGDYKEAELWYAKAAEQGNSNAEYRLALIAAAGNSNTAPDFVKAYKWAVIAAVNGDTWGDRAGTLRQMLDAHVSPADQLEGKKQAEAWRERRKRGQVELRTAAVEPPLPVLPGIKPSGGCPGWPFPNLPCRDTLPPIPGEKALPPPIALPQIAAPPAASPVAVVAPAPARTGPPPTAELDAALQRIDCASLREAAAPGKPIEISGTVPDEAERDRLVRTANRLAGGTPVEVKVDLMGAPLCRSLGAFDDIRRAGLAQAAGLDAHLRGNATDLSEGDPIRVEVKGGDRPLNLRIDYFALEGEVLHVLPSKLDSAARLPAGAVKIFGAAGDVNAGGAPFGNEFIAVVATAAPLDLGNPPDVEQAGDYLERLKKALRQAQAQAQSRGGPAIVATFVVHTHARQ
jgi:hypothetical protein